MKKDLNKKLIVGGLVAGGLMLGAAVPVIGAGIAKAETYGELNDGSAWALAAELRYDGVNETPVAARNLASLVCGERASGVSEGTVVAQLEQLNSSSVSIDAALGSEFHFCPRYERNAQTGGPLWPQFGGSYSDGDGVSPAGTSGVGSWA